MRAWKKTLYQILWGSLDERRKHGLVHLHDTLAGTPLHNRYWINGGLLLGCIREHRPLAHDDDADFSFWSWDRPHMLAAAMVLQARGFRSRRKRPNNDGSRTRWSFRYRGVDYDFIQMELVNGKIRWVCHAGKLGLELLNEVPNHGLAELELYGRTWMKPDDHETYLTSLYGDWRVPNPNYCPWEDSKAVIARYPLKKT